MALSFPRFSFLVISFLFFFAGYGKMFPQEKFPYGVFTANQPNEWAKTNNFQQIKDLGVNFIIHQLTPATRNATLANGLKIIGFNFDSTDFIATFTSGISTIYKPMGVNNTGYTENLVFQKGNEDSDGWKISIDDESGNIISEGPNVSQYPKYIPNYLSGRTIKYHLRFRMKVDELDGSHTPVCYIRVMYKCEGNFLQDVAGRTIYADELSNEYSDFTVIYTLDSLRDCEPFLWNEDGPNPHPSPSEFDFDDSYAPLQDGIHYRIYYYAKNDIYIQSVECVDELIWKTYMEDDPSSFTSELETQTDDFKDYQHVIGYSSIDEPHTIDLYKPFRVMQNAMNDTSLQPLYCLFYPEWNGIRNGNKTFQEFKDSANPQILNFYYFPFWQDDVPRHYSDSLLFVYWFFADRLNEATKIFPGYHYTAQSQSFIDPGSLPAYKLRWRKPLYYELTATLHLAMASGARGLVPSNYYSYPTLDENNTFYRTESLVFNTITEPSTFQTTGLYDSLKVLFKPRIQGTLGDRLMNLEYTEQFLRRRMYLNNLDGDSSAVSSDRLGMVVSYSQVDTPYMHHVGFFNDNIDSVNHRYFYLVNLRVTNNADSIKNIKLSFNRPSSQSFQSYRFCDIEGGLDTSFSAMIERIIPLRGGEGRIYEVLPSIRYGGILAVDDTVKAEETLKAELTIPAGKKLYIKANYTLQSNYMGAAGSIIGPGYVYIESGGSLTAPDWSVALVKGRSGNNPKLLWAPFQGLGTVENYKIYRRKQSESYQLIATVAANVTTYTDTQTSIIEGSLQNNETFSDYYVQVVAIPASEGPTFTENTDTISYARVEGEAPEKEGQNLVTLKEFAYSLEQNYPNPFNPETTFKYSLKQRGLTNFRIYDISGQLIKVLVNEEQEAGEYTLTFTLRTELPSGVYFYELV